MGRRQGEARCLLTGATGFLGSRVLNRLPDDVEVLALSRRPRPELRRANVGWLVSDLETPDALERVRSFAPSIVLHLAAMTDADACEREPERAKRVNELATRALADAAGTCCRRFFYVSTDLVFDGERGGYRESDEPRPLSVYGSTKLSGERAAASTLGTRATVARLALLYGRRSDPRERRSFADVMVARLREGEPVTVFADQFRTPIHVDDAAASLVALALRPAPPPPPIIHLGGTERVSRHDMGLVACEALGLSSEPLVVRSMVDVASTAPRPADVSLDTRLARSLGLPARPLRDGFLEWATGTPWAGPSAPRRS